MKQDRRILALLLGFAVSPSFAPKVSSQETSAATTPAVTSQASHADDVSLGEPAQWVIPKYPKRDLKSKIQGSVVLRITVSKEGTIKDVVVVSGNPDLADTAAKAVHQWKYVPYFREDQPTEAQTTVTFDFKITNEGKPEISAKFVVPKAPPAEEILTINDGITPPRILYQVDPEYTKSAREDKVQGTVVISAVVGSDGIPRNVTVSQSLRPDLDAQAVAAVSHYRFAAATLTKDKKRVAVHMNIHITFRLF